MTDLHGSETLRNLDEAYTRESQAAVRYRLFSQRADIDGEPEIAARFRSLADAATGHALGHLELLIDVSDPATAMPVTSVADSVQSALASERVDHDERYSAMADTAEAEGRHEIAAWFRSVARANHPERLDSL